MLSLRKAIKPRGNNVRRIHKALWPLPSSPRRRPVVVIRRRKLNTYYRATAEKPTTLSIDDWTVPGAILRTVFALEGDKPEGVKPQT